MGEMGDMKEVLLEANFSYDNLFKIGGNEDGRY